MEKCVCTTGISVSSEKRAKPSSPSATNQNLADLNLMARVYKKKETPDKPAAVFFSLTCKDWLENGKCKYGESFCYSHQRFTCMHFFYSGECKFGDSCQNSHEFRRLMLCLRICTLNGVCLNLLM